MVPFSLYMYRYTRRGMKSDVNEITNAWATRVKSERGTQAELNFITSSTNYSHHSGEPNYCPNYSHHSGEPEGPESGAFTAPARDCSLPTLLREMQRIPRSSAMPAEVSAWVTTWAPSNGAAVLPSTTGQLPQLCFPVSPSQLLPVALNKVQLIDFQLLFCPANNTLWFDSSKSHCIAKEC